MIYCEIRGSCCLIQIGLTRCRAQLSEHNFDSQRMGGRSTKVISEAFAKQREKRLPAKEAINPSRMQ